MDERFFEFFCHDALVKVRRKHIPRHHALPSLGQRICVGEFCDQRRVAVFFYAGQKPLPFFSETEDPGVLAVSGFPVIFHVFFLYIKKNMEQAPADAGVGDVLCLQELAELVDGDEVVRMAQDAVCQLFGHIQVLCQ